MDIINMILFFLAWLIPSIIFGYATQSIIDNKGYDENWFWWGFIFGILALILALAKPDQYQHAAISGSSSQLASVSDIHARERAQARGDWSCSCGRTNPGHTNTCTCGQTKRDVEAKRKAALADLDARKQASNENKNIQVLKDYKELLDQGVITEEEFQSKKEQIFNAH